MNPRGLGTAAFVLGLVAVLMAVTVAVVPAVAFPGSGSSSGMPTGQEYVAGAYFFLIDGVLVVVGVPVALLAFILGIVAAVRRRGRTLGIVGAVLGGLSLAALIVGVVVPLASTVVSLSG